MKKTFLARALLLLLFFLKGSAPSLLASEEPLLCLPAQEEALPQPALEEGPLSPAELRRLALSWAREQEGAFWDLDARHGAQCSDLVSAYMNLLCAGDPYAQVFGVYDARFYPTAARMQEDRWWVFTQASPLPGDIFVSLGGAYYGHTGIVLEAGDTSCLVIDQNSLSPSEERGCCAYLHRITWEGAYQRTHLIRFQGLWTLTEKPGTPQLQKLGEDRVTLLLSPSPRSTGLCLFLSSSPDFRRPRVIYSKKSSLTLRGLEGGQRYYLKARYYLDTPLERYYGGFCPPLSFKTR